MGLATKRMIRVRSANARPDGVRTFRSAHTAGLKACTTSEVLLQIDVVVEAGDLFAVAVEHQRLAHEELADAPFARLAPPRVVHFRVHVRVEAVLPRRRFLPAVDRLPVRGNGGAP